jgi:hypothetical protein
MSAKVMLQTSFAMIAQIIVMAARLLLFVFGQKDTTFGRGNNRTLEEAMNEERLQDGVKPPSELK